MTWTTLGDAVTVGGVAVGGDVFPFLRGTAVGDTSTSTIELDAFLFTRKGAFSRYTYLRMFGLWNDGASKGISGGYEDPPAVSLFLSRVLTSSPTTSDPVIRFVDSQVADATTSTPHSFAHEPGPGVFKATGVPHQRFGATLNYYARRTLSSATVPLPAFKHVADIDYNDPFVLHLPAFGALEAGRLMLLTRIRHIHGAVVDPAAQGLPGNLVDVVCFWAPEDDPGFSGSNVKGPFWLGACTDAVEEGHAFAEYRFSLGVPSACLSSSLRQGPSAQHYKTPPLLHVYFSAAASVYDMTIGGVTATMAGVHGAVAALGFVEGTYRRDLDLAALASKIAGTTTSPADGQDWNDDAPGADLIAGRNAGRVIVYSTAHWWKAAPTGSAADTTNISELGPLTDIQATVLAGGGQPTVVDAQVIRDADTGEITMFFRLGSTPVVVWAAIWRAKSLDDPGSFVVYLPTDRAVSDKSAADPDPVRRADGSWDVFYGTPGKSPAPFPNPTQRAAGS